MKKEIIFDLNLNSEQESLLEMHSFLNAMNVLILEISLLGMTFNVDMEFKHIIKRCVDVTKALTDKEKAYEAATRFPATKKLIYNTIDSVLDLTPDDEQYSSYQISISNINSIFNILDARIAEIIKRSNNPKLCVKFPIKELLKNFTDFFAAIEKNSKGKYRIVYDIAEHDKSSYFVNLDFSSVDGDTITIPSVFQDVMRDLLANARKYTEPGGRIDAKLSFDGKFLHFVVEDTGIGIPEHNIDKIFKFGFRAENALSISTRGGGFGLTKAYYVVKQFKGRMCIESELGKGTKISIKMPRNY